MSLQFNNNGIRTEDSSLLQIGVFEQKIIRCVSDTKPHSEEFPHFKVDDVLRSEIYEIHPL